MSNSKIPRKCVLIPERCKACEMCVRFLPAASPAGSGWTNAKGYPLSRNGAGKETACVHCEFCTLCARNSPSIPWRLRGWRYEKPNHPYRQAFHARRPGLRRRGDRRGCRFFAGYRSRPPRKSPNTWRAGCAGGRRFHPEWKTSWPAWRPSWALRGWRPLDDRHFRPGLSFDDGKPGSGGDARAALPGGGRPARLASTGCRPSGQIGHDAVRWGSHGDYAIVAYAPWSPQKMFDLTVPLLQHRRPLSVPRS